MNKRQTALAVIRIDVAKNGEVTREGLRAYVENRIGREAFETAIQQGRRIYDAAKGDQNV